MTDTERAELKRLAEAAQAETHVIPGRAWYNFRGAANPAAVLDLLREHEEDQGVIAVWRGRTERVEADIHRLGEVARTGGCVGQMHSDGAKEALKDVRALWVENERLKAEVERLRDLLRRAAGVLRDVAGMPIEADLLEAQVAEG